jgi:phospholipid/cholesterol/gamma-HCH transport system substrate-binding protein
MIFGQSKLELKVGIFVFLGIVLFTVFILSMKDFKNMTAGYELNFMFNFANGVKIGAPVRFAGVDVGEIKEIKFTKTTPDSPKPRVLITGSVKNNIQVPVDSTVWVNTLGLLGEKYIEIMPGKDFNNLLTPKQTLVGVDPIPMQEISVLASNIAKSLDEGLSRIVNKEGTIGKLLYDDKIYTELDAMVTDLRKHPWKLFWKGKEK